MKCKTCGADNSPGANYCAYCGGHLPLTESNEDSAIFARIKASPQWNNRESPERIAALPSHSGLQKIMTGGFFFVFIAIAGSGFVMMCLFSGIFGFVGSSMTDSFGVGLAIIPMLFSLMPLAMIGFGIFMFLKIQGQMNRIDKAPAVAKAVIVKSRRNHVSGGGRNSSASTRYFVTCEHEDGSRKEYQVWDGQLFGRMSEDDAGVLFTKEEFGLDFDRVVI